MEKTLDYPKKKEVITEVSECFPPRYQKIKRTDAPASWRRHTLFEFPAKSPPRTSLRISHPVPIPTNEAFESITVPAIPDSSVSIPVSPHARQWSNQSTRSQTPPRTPRKSFSNSIPIGRKSSDSTAARQQHISKGSASKLPPRPESRPVMPPAAFWQYAIDKQSVETAPGLLQRWQLEGDRRSLPSSIGQSSPIPTSSIKDVTPEGRDKGQGDKAKGKRSLDSLERRTFHRQIEGSCTEHIDGITWEIAGSPLAQPRGMERRSRKLVKKRQSSHPQSPGLSIVP